MIRFIAHKRRILHLALWACLLFAAVPPVHAQDDQVPSQDEVAAMDRVGRWKLINTAIFAVLLGWGIAKTAPRFFNARSADIQKAIKDATGLKLDADLRYSEMDRKMATLGDEVKRLREQGDREMDREHRRIRDEGEAERERLRRNIAAEIEGFRAEKRLELRRRTAHQAIELAEQQLRARGGEQDAGLLQDFIHLVERDANPGSRSGA